ncbi:MAG TPA: glycosyltransferase family 2 protein [Caldilineaceae bacterium]|nr:glycosyltransferase family 2 protein [Caldilineaceae bacterium]
MSSNAPTSPAPTHTGPVDFTVDLSVIIVSWNVWDLLRACLHSLEQASRRLERAADLRAFGPEATSSAQGRAGSARPTLEVIVVDNASADATAELVAARFPWVRLIRSADNLGFTRGNNVGYAASRGRFVYFLNPDTELLHSRLYGDSLWRLYSFVADNERVGLAGPQLRYADNSLQSSRRRFPTPLTGFWESTWLGRLWPGNPWARRFQMADWPGLFPHDVDWVVGAAMLARRAALEEIRQPEAAGPFDEGFFMYSEEIDLCRRLKQAGWRVVYVPDAVVVHYEGRSSEQAAAARHIYFNQSKVYYYEKYFGPRWAAALRRYLLLEFRWQLALERAKWLVGHKRALRAQRIAAYRAVIESGLRTAERETMQE